MRRARVGALWLLLLMTPCARGWGQRVGRSGVAPRARTVIAATERQGRVIAGPFLSKGRNSPWAIGASAALPGAGQAMLGSMRVLPYAGLEAFGWYRYAGHARERRHARDSYRDLAARVARAPFSTDTPIGNFDYYERMEHFVESGRFDVVPGGALDPETDTLTYNGYVWLLARRTYWPNPFSAPDTTSSAWTQSIDFYRRRAYDQSYRWSWKDSPAALGQYRALVARSNTMNRRAIQDLSLVMANHMLSAIDALITVRIRMQASDSPSALQVEVSRSVSVPNLRLHW